MCDDIKGPTPAEQKKANGALATLESVRASVARANPGKRVVWYLDAGQGLFLMVEPAGQTDSPDEENIAYEGKLLKSTGGDW